MIFEMIRSCDALNFGNSLSTAEAHPPLLYDELHPGPTAVYLLAKHWVGGHYQMQDFHGAFRSLELVVDLCLRATVTFFQVEKHLFEMVQTLSPDVASS